MNKDYEVVETDVLVVGAGGAACRAALEASLSGARVLLAVKGAYASIGVRGSGSTAGGVSDRGGVAYPGIPGIQGFDPKSGCRLTPEQDYANILQLGLGMTDPALARVMAERGYELIHPLVSEWSREVVPRQWGMKSHGIPIMFGLTRILRETDVQVREHTMVARLLLADGGVAGAVAVDELTGETIVIRARAVVLGTGGMGGMFKHTLTSLCTTGDGHSMAYRAGADLMNVEFKQVFPGVVWPTVNHFSAWFFVPHVRITNALGEEYIQNYLPDGITLEDVYEQRGAHGPFSARDTASRYFDVASMLETKAGRANEHDALYVDLTDPRVVDPLAKPRHDYFYYRGVRYLEEPIQFNICFHCSNGGVRVDENAQSTVHGLYAAGECAAGMHGANRMAGHMLGSSQIFGALAGRHAAGLRGTTVPDSATAEVREAVAEIDALRRRRGSEKPSEVARELRRVCWDNMLVHVNQSLLERALDEIAEIRDHHLPRLKVETAEDLVDALELDHMVQSAEILARATEMRKESRGDLYREDYPDRDDANWKRVILVRRRNETMDLRTEVIDPDWSDRLGDMLGIRWG